MILRVTRYYPDPVQRPLVVVLAFAEYLVISFGSAAVAWVAAERHLPGHPLHPAVAVFAVAWPFAIAAMIATLRTTHEALEFLTDLGREIWKFCTTKRGESPTSFRFAQGSTALGLVLVPPFVLQGNWPATVCSLVLCLAVPVWTACNAQGT